MKYNEEQRKRIIEDGRGKTIMDLEWDEEDEYWTAILSDGTEFSFRFMTELV